jgi:limonene-1,2-epoxide hydrolase
VKEWEVELETQEEAENERVVRLILTAMTEEDEEAAKQQWTELAKERAQLDSGCTEVEVEQEATWYQETLSKVLDAPAKIIRICLKSKRWWNRDIKARRNTLGQEKRRRERYWEGAARAKTELQKFYSEI